MGGVVCTLSNDGRHSMSTSVTCINLLLSFAGQSLVMVALVLKFVLEKRVAVVIGNHGGALAYFLIAVGCLLSIVSTTAAKVTYDGSMDCKATRRTSKLLVFTQACQLLSFLLLVSAIIMCVVHKSLIKDVLHYGIISAIRLYRINPIIKKGLDTIQLSFSCCGSRGIEDWLNIPWIHIKYLNINHPEVVRHIKNGEFIKDDAPFSCCDARVIRPCIHHDVHHVMAHPGVGPTGTLHKVGCNDALEQYWNSSVLTPILWILMLITLFLVLSILLSRLLQTSLDSALDAGDAFGMGDAFCIRTWPCSLIPTSDPAKIFRKKSESINVEEGFDKKKSRDLGGFTNKLSSNGLKGEKIDAVNAKRKSKQTTENSNVKMDDRRKGLDKRVEKERKPDKCKQAKSNISKPKSNIKTKTKSKIKTTKHKRAHSKK